MHACRRRDRDGCALPCRVRDLLVEPRRQHLFQLRGHLRHRDSRLLQATTPRTPAGAGQRAAELPMHNACATKSTPPETDGKRPRPPCCGGAPMLCRMLVVTPPCSRPRSSTGSVPPAPRSSMPEPGPPARSATDLHMRGQGEHSNRVTAPRDGTVILRSSAASHYCACRAHAGSARLLVGRCLGRGRR